MQRLVAVGLLAATLATDGPSQAPEVRTSLGLAQRKKDDDPEQAATLSRRAWLLASLVKNDRERRLLQGQVTDLLREIDRQEVGKLRTLERTLQHFREFAADYSARGWYESAETMLRAGELLLPEAVADDLKQLQQKRAVVGAPAEATATSPNETLLDWLGDGHSPYGDDFAVSDDAVASPKLVDGLSKGWFSRKSFRGDGRLRIDIGMKNVTQGTAGFAWSEEREGDIVRYFLAELDHVGNGLGLGISRIEATKVHRLAYVSREMKCPEARHWHVLEVIVSGRTVAARIDDQEPVAVCSMDRENSGALGLFVSGNSKHEDPVLFRHLEVESFAPYTAR